MRIVKLQAENVKRLVAVEIEPDGALVQITGRNGAGKSSVLDAIWWALGGRSTHQEQPIRKGQEQARIRLDLGELIVTRDFARDATKGGTSTRIRVENADGARYPSPQAMLDKLLGSLTFDPLAFMRGTDRQQVEALSGLCGVDMAAVEVEHRGDYERRRDANRAAKQCRVAADLIDVPADTPEEPVSIDALVQRVRDAEATNREREAERIRREREADRIANTRDEAMMLERSAADRQDRAETEAVALEKRAREIRLEANTDAENDRQSAAALKSAASRKESELANLPAVEADINTAEIQAEIRSAGTVNENVANAKRKRDLLAEAKGNEDESKTLTTRMDNRRAKVQKAIAAADLPVEGLSVADGRVLLDDLPLDQASDAKRLRVSCAIAMRSDAKLRVLRVRDGSLLDPDSLALLQEMAETAGYQVWVEMVDTTGKVGIVIEDGRVAS